MSRDDPGAASGMQVYDEHGPCTCTHPVTFHVIGVGYHRGACSASTCPCRRYTEDTRPAPAATRKES